MSTAAERAYWREYRRSHSVPDLSFPIRENHSLEDRGHSSPCWIWQGVTQSGGYGTAAHHGWRGMAHRLYYEAYKGGIPDGMDIDHLCRERSCVNPDHLEPVTHLENCLRGDTSAGRVARTGQCKHGHDLTVDGAYIYRRNASRICRECNRLNMRRRKECAA